MPSLEQLRKDVSQSWDNLMQGWRHLAERAGGALTRFIPVLRNNEPSDNAVIPDRQRVRWSMLAADVFDDGNEIVVKLEAPGMDSGDFDIQIQNDMLVIRGEKRFQREQNKGRYHLMECAYGRFERAVPLPAEVDETKAKAHYKRGLLHVTLPKTGQDSRKRIKVSAA